MTDRTASNVIFSDCKDRLLRVPPHAMFGAYYAAFNQGRLPSADALHPSNHAANAPTSGTPSSNLSAAAIAAATAFGGAVADLASILATGHTSHDTVQQVAKLFIYCLGHILLTQISRYLGWSEWCCGASCSVSAACDLQLDHQLPNAAGRL